MPCGVISKEAWSVTNTLLTFSRGTLIRASLVSGGVMAVGQAMFSLLG